VLLCAQLDEARLKIAAIRSAVASAMREDSPPRVTKGALARGSSRSPRTPRTPPRKLPDSEEEL
jgi:hypothetical protein